MSITLPILMYHRVAVPEAGDKFAHLCVTPERFREHLAALSAWGWKPATGEELAAAVESGTVPGKRVLLTFDDGTADLFAHALPELLEAGWTGVVFLAAGRMEQDAAWLRRPDNENPPAMLSWAQIREMAEAGIEFGAHTLSHPRLSQLPPEAQRREIEDSRKKIEDETARPVPLFCYPYGDYSAETVEIVRAAGFRAAVSTQRGIWHAPEDRFTLTRVPIQQDVTRARLRYRVSWLYGLKYSLRGKKETSPPSGRV